MLHHESRGPVPADTNRYRGLSVLHRKHLSTQNPSASAKAGSRTLVSELAELPLYPFQRLCSEGSAQQAPGQPWLHGRLEETPLDAEVRSQCL